MRSRLLWLALLVNLAVSLATLPSGPRVRASLLPTLSATWGAPAIDGVFSVGEWNLSALQLSLVDIWGGPSYNFTTATLPLRVGVATDAWRISVAVQLGGFHVLETDYTYRLYIAMDTGRNQTESKRGYAVNCDLLTQTPGNSSYMFIFSRSPDNGSLWWMTYGEPRSTGRVLRWGVEGLAGQVGNYSYETCVPYYSGRWGESYFGLTRTSAFRLHILFQVRFIMNYQARYVWTYCWPNSSLWSYVDHADFDPALFDSWCVVATQWVEPPPPFTVPPEVFVVLGVGVAIAVVVGVAVWLVSRWRGIRQARRRAVEHWRSRRRRSA